MSMGNDNLPAAAASPQPCARDADIALGFKHLGRSLVHDPATCWWCMGEQFRPLAHAGELGRKDCPIEKRDRMAGDYSAIVPAYDLAMASGRRPPQAKTKT